MAQPLPVLVNRTGGAAAAMGDALGAGIEAAFAEAGREIVLELLEPSQIASAITRHADAPVVVVGARNHITPAPELEDLFFPQAEWIVDAVHERILPLPGHVPTSNWTDGELVRRTRLGV